MPRPLPESPDLDQLRRQARELLRACRAGDPAALAALREHAPAATAPPRLSDAQLALARSYGAPSWPALTRAVEAAQAARPSQVAAPKPQPARPTRRELVASLAARVVADARAGRHREVVSALQAPLWQMLALRDQLAREGTLPLVVDSLLACAEDPLPRARFDAAQMMDHFGDQRCAATLMRLLDDPVPRVRWAALHSVSCDACKLAPLAVDGDLAGKVVALALEDPSVRVRRVAGHTLRTFCDDPRARLALGQLGGQAGS
jgi:hypothetical protein